MVVRIANGCESFSGRTSFTNEKGDLRNEKKGDLRNTNENEIRIKKKVRCEADFFLATNWDEEEKILLKPQGFVMPPTLFKNFACGIPLTRNQFLKRRVWHDWVCKEVGEVDFFLATNCYEEGKILLKPRGFVMPPTLFKNFACGIPLTRNQLIKGVSGMTGFVKRGGEADFFSC